MTANDARATVKLHKEHHGIDGMFGSLDVTKVQWANCPSAWHGQFQGKEGVPTIALEAVADYNLWIWHDAFGFPGGLNDLNIWEKSSHLESFQDGTFSELDFEYEINGEKFDQLFALVDGIYPQLSRFLQTISVPISKIDSHYSGWQEAKRKDIERAFGVLKKKFHLLAHAIRMAYRDDIFYAVRACTALHNMMVETRLNDLEEVEDSSHYEVVEEARTVTPERRGNDDVEAVVDAEEEDVRGRMAAGEGSLNSHVVDLAFRDKMEQVLYMPRHLNTARISGD
ncbi:hypothetical protein ACHAWF_012507 [Thalassiosira exigua]